MSVQNLTGMASSDLSLGQGDQLKSQLEAQIAEQKKKKQVVQAGSSLSPAASALGLSGINSTGL